MMYTKQELKAQLKDMGILPSDTVVIHTSMKAIGETEDGPNGIIDTFCEYLAEGMLIVPTHTWDVVTPKQPVYDVRTTVPNIGLIPRIAAARKDGVRSLHPTHSMWAWGKDAEAFVEGEENAPSPTPVGFCWDKLGDVGAKILLIGVENDKNTFIHAIDERAKLPDRISPDTNLYTIIDRYGNRHMNYQHAIECSKTEDISWFYGNFEKPLVEMGVQTFGKLGSAVVRMMDALACRNLIQKIYSRSAEDIFAQHIDLPESLYKD